MTRFTFTTFLLSFKKKFFCKQYSLQNRSNTKFAPQNLINKSKVILFAFLMFLGTSIFAQLGIYSFTGIGSCPNQNPNVLTQPANATFSTFVNINATCVSTNDIFGNQDWNNTGVINLSQYNEFTITPSLYYSLNLSAITLTHFTNENALGNTNWILRSSLDGFTSDLATGSTDTIIQSNNITLPFLNFSNVGTVTFRLYIVNANSNNTIWSVDDVTITGSVVAIPPATPSKPISDSPQCSATGVTLNRNATPPSSDSWYWQTSANGTNITNSSSTYNVTISGTYYIRARNNSNLEWSVEADSINVVVLDNVSSPVFTLGTTSTRCQGAGNVTYTATANNATGVTYSIDTASISAGNLINSTTGVVTYVANWIGTSTITAVSSGCNGPLSSVHTITTTPTIGTPVFDLGTSTVRCQGAGNVTYNASATNTTGITYTLDATSRGAGNTISAATGAVTYVSTWSGTSTITASAAGCNGPLTATHTVTITATVGNVSFVLGATSSRCIGAGAVTYTANSTTTSGITYSLDSISIVAGNSIILSSGQVTYTATWSGISYITATSTGCNGPKTATHTVTMTPNVGTPTFTIGATSTRCQSSNNVTYTATATNSTSIFYSIDATSISGGNSINSSTGNLNYNSSWIGTTIITATAYGCYGPTSSTHTATTNPTINTPVFALGSSSTRCQGAGLVTYTATSNTSAITYSLNTASITAGNSINTTTGEVTYVSTWNGTSTITATAAGCNGPRTATHTVTITPTVGTPVFTAGATTTRCQGAGTVTYGATASNSTGITYSLDAASLSGLNTINSSTGAVTYNSNWNGTSIITANAAGCNGPLSATHTVTITPFVGTPVFTLGSSSIRCQSSNNVTYTATSTNATSITYSLDNSSISGGNSINSSTGYVNYSGSWSGTSTITASAAGCNGPRTSSHTVTITPTVGTPVFALGATSSRCQAGNSVTYSATATNTTGMSYGLDASSLGAGNTINTSTGEVTFTSGWSGTSTITASATGCNGPRTANHTITINPPVSAPVFSLGTSTTRCQASGNLTYSATADNSTGITYSLDAASLTGGNSINAASGTVTYSSGWNGTSVITASAAGCYGPVSSSHTVTITPPVSNPIFDLGSNSIRCQGGGTIVYNATANNATGITYFIDITSQFFGVTVNVNTGAVTFPSYWNGTTFITARASGCSGPAQSTHTVIITPTVANPVFSSGATSTRCQGANSVTYGATAADNTGIVYTLDSLSLVGGNTIISSTGRVTYHTNWNGTSVITATASGCNGPKSAIHTVTITPTVGTPVFGLGATSIRCQGSATVSYSATATNTTGLTYSLDATTAAYPGNTINTSTGSVTYASGWSGTTTVTATASGCNGPRSASHTATITPSVTTPVFAMGSSSTRCQGGNTVTYGASANNTTGISYTLDFTSLDGGNTINAATGLVTYNSTWNGTTTVTAIAPGCNGPRTTTHTVTVTPSVGTPVFSLGSTSVRCQGSGSVTYMASATSTTGITYSLDASTLAFAGNSINSGNGQVTYATNWNGTSVITAIAAGCNGPTQSSHTVTITPTVSNPVFASGTTSTRCQGSGITTYTATATNATVISYSIDIPSMTGGNSINSSTGALNFVSTWSGTTTVTATATGCNGPRTSTHTITITPTVGNPIFAFGTSSTRCQSAGTVLYAATSTNSTSITYSLDSASLAAGNTINSSTGSVIYTSDWSGTSVIRVTSTGCNGPKTATHTVTITPNGSVSFNDGTSSYRFQGAGNVTYGATSNNGATITYSLDAASIAAGNSINPTRGIVTYVYGWIGTSIITATVNGCNGQQTATHTAVTEFHLVTKQLYLSDPGQSLDRVDPVSTGDISLSTTQVLSVLPTASVINVDNTSTGFGLTGPITIAHTTGTNNNRLMLVGIAQKTTTVTSVTYGGTALTLVGENNTSNNARVAIYSLLNPPSGNANVVVNFSGTPNKGAVVGVTTYSGVAQTGTLGVFNSATNTTGNPTVSPISTTGELVFDVVSIFNRILTNGSGKTQRWNLNSGSDVTGGGSTKPGATPVTMDWTAGGSGGGGDWAIGAVSIRPIFSLNDSTTFTQNPSLCSKLIIKADSIKVLNYVTVTSGTMPVNPNIRATLSYGTTNILTLTNPVYNSAKQLLTWSGILPAEATIPAGQAIKLTIKTFEPGVSFRIDYDNNVKPSEVKLMPVSTYIDITSFNLYSAPYPAGIIVTGGLGSGNYYGRINVTDPFGTDDITNVSVLINPTGNVVTATPIAVSGCNKTYEFIWNSPSNNNNTFKFLATANEGYENTVTDVQDLVFDVCTACPPVASNDSAKGAGGAPLTIDVLANDTDPNNNINKSTLAVINEPTNGSVFISNNQIVYVPNGTYTGKDTIQYRICDSTTLCATAFIYITIDPTIVDICSDAPNTHVYFIPYPEQDAWTALKASASPTIPSNNIETIISLTMLYPNMVVIWDEWEDGYEVNALNPTQSTTKIWGDGNPYNGIAPGYPNDIIPAGSGIILKNTMVANPRNPLNIYYDGKDKITSSGQIAVTQVCSEPSITSVQDLKTNVTSVFDFGKSFTIPVGQDFNSQDFAYTALFIRASEDNTTINIDKDNNGVIETTINLNQGNSYLVNGGVLVGATVISDKPIGVELSSGGIDNYSIRNAPIYPATWYSNIYYTPVPTSDNPSDVIKDTSSVMLYNSLNRPITINWTSGIPSSGSIVIPARKVVRFPLPYTTTGAFKFVNPTGESFTAIEIVDSYTPGGGGNSGKEYDWSFNLISESRLTDFVSTAWAPGGLDLVAPPGPDVNGNPIWVTPSANTTIYVKYDGKVSGSAGSSSPCGLKFDRSYNLNALNYIKIRDSSDNDQSGIAIYTCNGVKLAAVYGEDPQGSISGATAFWDVGTTIQPFCRNKIIFANDDYAYTIINTPVTISVLKNDNGFLAEVNPLTVKTAGFLQPKNGTTSINSNGTILYSPNVGFAGIDTFEYQICSTPSPVVCDIANVYVTVNACPAPASQNIISGMAYQDKNRDGLNNDGREGYSPAKIYLYNDGNCNAAIDVNELIDSVVVDTSGYYQFINYPEKTVADRFQDANNNNTCAFGSSGNTPWASNWTDIGNSSPSSGMCVARSLGNADVDVVRQGINNFALRLKDASKSATRIVNLSNATRAFLSFSYKRASTTLTAGEDIIAQISTNGSTFSTVFTISGDGTRDTAFIDVLNQDISAFNGATTYIRFLTNPNVDEEDSVFIDNVSIKFLKYPQCYITRIDPSTISSNYYLTTPIQRTFTAVNAASCLSPYDFGLARNIITLSGTIFNDLNGLKDGLVNGVTIGSPSAATLYAYLAYPSGIIAYKTTVNPVTGTYSFPLAEVYSDYILTISTLDSAVNRNVPQRANLPMGWVSVGDAYGVINGAGTGNEPGIPNSSVPVTTFNSSIANINFGIEQAPETAISVQAQKGNPGGFVNINIPSSAFTTSNVGVNPNTIDYGGGTVNEIFIPEFPFGANSLTVGSVVYLNGGSCPPGFTCTSWPSAGVTITAPNGVPAQTVSVDPIDGNIDVVIKIVAIDNAGVRDTTPGSITIPFRTISLSGMVWNDVNGNKIQDGSEAAINGFNVGAGVLTGSPLYMNLIDATGLVIVASVPVQYDGTFFLPFVPQSSSGIVLQLSTNQGVVGLPKPVTALPIGWKNTGENKNGQGGVADILNNGEIILTTSTTNITAQNFGIEQMPQTAINLQLTIGNPGGFNTINIPASAFLYSNVGTFPNTEDYNGGVVTSIRITSFPTNTNSIIINNVIYTNSGTCPPLSTCVGWPAGGVIIPAPDGIIAQSVFIDPLDGNNNVIISMAAMDNAGIEDDTPGSITIPFRTITLSGYVWNDRNENLIKDGTEANFNGTNTGAGIVTGSTLYINLIDGNGKVIASQLVQSNGTYTFPFVPQNSSGLILQLSNNQGTVGLNGPLTNLPRGWINTGENKNGQGGIPDTRANGEIPLTTTAASISMQNFGIEGKPIAIDDANTTDEDIPVNGNVSTNDTPSGDGGNIWTLIGINGGANNGTVVLNTNGTYTYIPNANYYGIDTFYYSLCDIDNDCDSAKVIITINSINDLPFSLNDYVSVYEDSSVTATVITNDILSGDGGNIWTLVGLNGGASHGIVTMNPIGTYTYIPNPDYNGRDTFQYRLCDIDNDCSTAFVFITVISVNDLPITRNDVNSTLEDTPVSGTVIANDIPSGDGGNIWSLVGVNGQASNGTVVMNPDGFYTYTPNPDFNGLDTFIYKLCDIDNDCSISFVFITVISVNDLPIAVNDSITILEDIPVTNTVINNDTPSGDGGNFWALVGVNGGANNGTVIMAVNGTYTYSPNPNFNGRDSFVYQLCDVDADCDYAKVYITIIPVNDPPIIRDTVVTTPEDSTITVCLPITDYDAGDTHTSTTICGPYNGTIGTPVVIGRDLCITYTPTPNYNGRDSICVVVCDNANTCDTAIITIIITPVNDPPIIRDTVVTTPEDSTITVCLPITDYDAGDTHTSTTICGPYNGTIGIPVVIGRDVCITYTPTPNYNGRDSICVVVCDNANTCDTAIITIIITPVNDPPIIRDTVVTTPEDSTITVCLPITDYDAGDTHTSTTICGPYNGTIGIPVVIGRDVCITYTPTPNYNGRDSICVVVCDNANTCDTAIITIIITPVNDPPIIRDTVVTTPEDSTITVCLPITDYDAGDTHTSTTICGPYNGTIGIPVVIGRDVCITYTPTPNYNGRDSICVVVCDNANTCDTAIITIIITPVNDPPIIRDTVVTTPEDSTITVCLPITDYDAGDTHTSTTICGPYNGTIGTPVVIGRDVCITYTPTPNYNGRDSICVVVCDNANTCDTAIITIIITPVNNYPIAQNDFDTTCEESPTSGDVSLNNIDIDGPGKSYTVISGPNHGSIILNLDGTYSYTPLLNYNGKDTILYSYCDLGTPNLCDTATLFVLITPVNDSIARDIIVECDGAGNTVALAAWLLSNGGASNGDSCYNCTWTNNFFGLSNGCGNNGSATVIFTNTYDCGSTTTSATFTIEDTTSPTIDTPARDTTVECDGAGNTAALQAWLSSNGNASANDICSGTVTWSNDYSSLSDDCGNTGTATVVFTATDACGNATTTSATFTIEDTTSPTIDTPARDTTVECDGAGNTAALQAWLSSNGNAAASDVCSGTVTWSNDYTALSDDCGNTGTATVVFTATDACGNATTTSATFTIEDTTSPTIDTPARDTTVECDGAGNTAALQAWLSSNGNASANDICSGTVTWSNDYSILSDDCGNTGTATVVFTATDACGNATTTSATFTIEDTTSPTIDTPARDTVVICDGQGNNSIVQAWLLANGNATASDVCSGSVTWTNNFGSVNGDCGASGSVTVTFTATDACGNFSTTTASLSIIDTVPPVIATPARDTVVECDGAGNTAALQAWLSSNGNASASDVCSGTVTWSNDYSILSDDCGNTGTATVVFTATDACGNATTTSATFTIEDTTSPTIDTPARDTTVECDGAGNTAALQAWLASNGNASASDICSGTVTWSNDYSTLSDDCGNTGTATVVFTATDACGNATTTSATFTIEDTTSPTIATPARDTVVICDGQGNNSIVQAWLLANGNATASDVCSGSVTWTNNFGSVNGDCGASGSVTVTFTATDACGNFSTTTASLSIIDTVPPVIATPARDTVVECDGAGNTAALQAWLSSNGNAAASDVCSGTVTWSNDYTALSDDCGNTGTATVVFTATDACGNATTTSATFTIEDTTSPTIDTPARDTVVECDGAGNTAALQAWLSSNGNAAASDICSGTVTWSNDYTALSDDCGNTGTATVVFTATDACGNATTTSATFTIEDTTSPTIATPARDTVVICDGQGNNSIVQAWLLANGNATASDVCSGSVTWTNNFGSVNGDCGASGSVTVTFTATDACGNFSTTTASLSIIDTVPPVIATPARDTVVECDGAGNTAALQAWLSSNGNAAASDVCSGTVTWSNDYTALSDDCGNTGTATVVFTATDACGNATTTSATFTIEDTTSPTIATPARDTVVICDGQGNNSIVQAWLLANGNATASDVCSGSVTWTNNFGSVNGDCGASGSVTVTFTATDACGNFSTTTASLSIIDTVPPVIATPARDTVVECDGAGNTAALQAWLSSNGNAAASDICSGTVTWSNDYTALSDDCGNTGTATVVFTATDACGNATTTSATFTIEDTTSPTIATPARDTVVICDGQGNNSIVQAWLLANGNATASDVCSGSVTWTNNFGSVNGDCGASGSVTVTFTATDACGNFSTTTASLSIIDTVPPVIATPARDTVVECDGAGNTAALQAWLSSNGNAAASDVCSGTVTWSNDYTALSDDCGNTGTATVVFTATDACGNATTTSATFTIEDTTSPTIATPARDTVVICDGQGNNSIVQAWLLANGNATASDVCSGSVTWTNNFGSVNGDCGASGSVTVTFTATDACGNFSTTTASLSIIDTVPPVIATPARDTVVECDGAGNTAALQAWLSSNGNAAASDVCSGTVTWSNDYTALSDDCGNTGTATVVFTATDACGNATTTSATFTIEDTTSPTIDTPARDTTVECDGAGNTAALQAWLSSNGNASANDICSGTVTWSNDYSILSDDCGNTGTATVVFTATDACGNATTTSATFTIEDTTSPTIDTPARDTTVECDGAGNTAALQAWLSSNGNASASDICSGTVTWSNDYSILSDDCGNTGTATVVFTATDACGNATTTSATFTIEDTTSPTIDTPARDTVVECDGAGNTAALQAWLSSNGNAAASDICSGTVTWSNDYSILSDDCGNTGTATIVFTATDACGNATTTSATFTIEDTIPPVFINTLPIDENVCKEVTPPSILSATDNCGSAVVTFTETVDSTSVLNSTIYIRTWTAKDECQNIAIHQQNINVAHVLNVKIDTTICEGSSIIIGNNSFNTTGNYQIVFRSVNGCDSIVLLNLSVNPTKNETINTVICKGDTVKVAGQLFTTNTTNQIITLSTSQGCDSIITLNVVVLEQDTLVTNRVICAGDSVEINGITFNTSGTYYIPFLNTQCVGIIELHVTVNQPTDTLITRSICEGESFVLAGQVFNTTGIYIIKIRNTNGCDSTITLNLNIIPSASTTIYQTICSGEGYTVGANLFFATGVYIVELENINGCDSIITLNLSVLSNDTININSTICQGQSIVIAGQTFSTSNIYTIKLKNSLGCDSIILFDLTVKICEIQNPIIRDTTIFDTLLVNDTIKLCNLTSAYLDDLEINACDGSIIGITPIGSSWTIDSLGCLVYVAGPTKGNDTLCIRECMKGTDTCATTTVIITVTGFPPVALDDSVTTTINTPITIPILGNDSTRDEDPLMLCDDDAIVVDPMHGTVVVNNDGTITYIPVTGYIGLDSFQYQICDPEGRDSAWVYVSIRGVCDIPNAISPNGDGINDVFIIPCGEGDVVFNAYNRWGIEVYRSERYLNDWDGRYKGSPLPDGTYYYVVKYRTSGGEEINRAGFITIHR